MRKTKFSKSQLIQISKILITEELIPCDQIFIYNDMFNSGIGNIYSVIKFVKGKKQLDVGFVTETYPENLKLQAQLYQYFGGNE